MTRTSLLLISALLLSACTTPQIYNSLQENARDNCNKTAGTDKSDCLKLKQTDYETYKKQREEVTGSK